MSMSWERYSWGHRGTRRYDGASAYDPAPTDAGTHLDRRALADLRAREEKDEGADGDAVADDGVASQLGVVADRDLVAHGHTALDAGRFADVHAMAEPRPPADHDEVAGDEVVTRSGLRRQVHEL